MNAGPALLEVRDLDIRFGDGLDQVHAVRSISFDVAAGETVALVGESGSGKSATARSVLRLLPPPGRIHGGRITFEGRDLVTMSDREIRQVRGDRISMVFQEPMTSLNPVHTIGQQIGEVLRLHRDRTAREAAHEAVSLLEQVGIGDARLRARQYPHNLSGGMQQRVMIAMALACAPRLLIADEPTTALDVTVQAQILSLLRDITNRTGTAVLLITHDLGVVEDIADRVLVMEPGVIVESGRTSEILQEPRHPYTQRLLAARPNPDTQRGHLGEYQTTSIAAPMTSAYPAHPAPPVGQPLVVVKDLVKEFAHRSLWRSANHSVRAVRGVSFGIASGTTLGLVGESGSGKSTTGRLVTRLLDPTSGSVTFGGQDITTLRGDALRVARAGFQTIFQDPYGSLDPRHDVAAAIAEPLVAHDQGSKEQRRDRIRELLTLVGLPTDFARRLPHQLSGGQRQRVAIARALSVHPRLVVCDEPVSSLDVSIQAQVVNLLVDLQQRLGLTYLFVSHDLALVRHVSDEIAVMYLGRIVEHGAADEVYRRPRHPYTRSLIASMPGRRRVGEPAIKGEIPSVTRIPPGCSFAGRCPFVQERCRVEDPQPIVRAGHLVACHRVDELPEFDRPLPGPMSSVN